MSFSFGEIKDWRQTGSGEPGKLSTIERTVEKQLRTVEKTKMFSDESKLEMKGAAFLGS